MIDWSTINTVLLDMDGTLLDLHYDNYFWLHYLPSRYASIHNVPEHHARERLHAKIQSEKGQLNWYCIDYWSEQFDVDIAALKTEINDRIEFLPHAEELLQQLDALPLETAIVTNAHRKTVAIKEAVIQISSYVDKLWSSHDFGLAKEDPAFWPAFARQQAFDPSTTVFIDDNEAVLAAAAKFGIKHLVLPLKPDSQQASRPTGERNGYIGVQSLADLLV